MGNKMSCYLPNRREKMVQLIKDEFEEVLHMYVSFLRKTAEKLSKDSERDERKFTVIKNELMNFILRHRQFLRFIKVCLLSNDEYTILDTIAVSNSDEFEQSFNKSDFLRLNSVLDKHEKDLKISYCIKWVDEKIIETLKAILGKPTINKEDIQLFLENHFLVDRDDLDTKCSNYKELSQYIYTRFKGYHFGRVSTLHIEQISFDFSGSIEGFEEEKSCAVCLEDYETNQQVCHLPCNHFCCRNCTVKMFAVPEDVSLKAYFQCPICRADCT